jgi:hypothetical protein
MTDKKPDLEASTQALLAQIARVKEVAVGSIPEDRDQKKLGMSFQNDILLTELADTREKLRISDALLREQIRLYQDIGERLTAETEKRRELEEALQASRKLNVELLTMLIRLAPICRSPRGATTCLRTARHTSELRHMRPAREASGRNSSGRSAD